MPKLILPADHLAKLIRTRRHLGIDQRDEVWNGVYVVSPEADNEHQQIGRWLANALESALGGRDAVQVFHGANVSDREVAWRKNFRVPDVSVFLPGNLASDRGSYWMGGPDFAVEVMSPGDRSRKKFGFYASVGVREILLVNRQRWELELHRRHGESWQLVGKSRAMDPLALSSDVLGLEFRLIPGERRPAIEVLRTNPPGRWLV